MILLRHFKYCGRLIPAVFMIRLQTILYLQTQALSIPQRIFIYNSVGKYFFKRYSYRSYQILKVAISLKHA